MKEEWRDVLNYIGRYQVSNFGRVKSLSYEYVDSRGHRRVNKGRVLKNVEDRHGYHVVCLHNINQKNHKVHRLVALAFIDNPEELPIINHRNGVKTDNTVDNLEWCSYKYNTNHAFQNGLCTSGEGHHYSTLSDDEVLKVKKYLKEGKNVPEINKITKINKPVLYQIKNGISWNYLTGLADEREHFGRRSGKDHPQSKKIVNCRGQVFDSVNIAARELNIAQSSISCNLKGSYKSAGKYPDGNKIVWKYYKDVD